MNKPTLVVLLVAMWLGIVYCNDYYPKKKLILDKIKPVVPIVETIVSPSRNSEYNAPPPPPPPPQAAPPVVESYPSAPPSTVHFKTLCPKSSTGQQQFYMPHSEKREWFLQCDQNGEVFLKFCPPGTIFTEKLVCEETEESLLQRVAISSAAVSANSYNPIVISVTPMTPVVQLPMRDTYGYAADQPSTGSISMTREAPEFRALCDSRRSLARASFFLPHPTERTWFIQCDEFGNAFLQSCPQGLFFTKDFLCKREGEDIETTIVERPQPAMIMRGPSLSTYQSGAISDMSFLTSTSVDSSRRAPEFDESCRSKLRSGVIVFYMKHPSDESLFIQCDESSAAYVKQCPGGLIFDEKLACARREDIKLFEKFDQLQQTRVLADNGYSSSGDASSSSIGVSTSQSGDFGLAESIEFKHLCLSKPTDNGYGGVLNNAFFLPHPFNDKLYIQCDEFGRAFIRQCQFGTVFVAESKACEKESETRRVMITQTDSYGAPTKHEDQTVRKEMVILDSTPAPIILMTQAQQVAYPTTETIVVTTEAYGQQEQIKVAKFVPVAPTERGY